MLAGSVRAVGGSGSGSSAVKEGRLSALSHLRDRLSPSTPALRSDMAEDPSAAYDRWPGLETDFLGRGAEFWAFHYADVSVV